MTVRTVAARLVEGTFGPVGRLAYLVAQTARGSLSRGWKGVVGALSHASGIWHLFVLTLYHTFVAPFRTRTKLRQLLFPMMSSVGVASFPIVAMISALMGMILVLQSGEAMRQYGQLYEVPGVVALSMVRELSPLLTAIIMTARVGASFTAVLGSMRINEEIMALETLAIHPVGYLVAPRFLSMIVMVPCLTVFSYLISMAGGALIAETVYEIPYTLYIEKTISYLKLSYLFSGLIKALVFSILITVVSCYYGLITEGGPVGLGRNTMVAVVTCLVVVLLADTITTAFFVNYLFPSSVL